MTNKRMTIRELFAFIAMLICMLMVSMAVLSASKIFPLSPATIKHLIASHITYNETNLDEITTMLGQTPIMKSLYLSLAGGFIWWSTILFFPPKGPGEGRWKKLLWFILLTVGSTTTAILYYIPIIGSDYERWIPQQYYLLLGIVPVFSFMATYAIGTMLASPSSISGSVPFFNMRKYY